MPRRMKIREDRKRGFWSTVGEMLGRIEPVRELIYSATFDFYRHGETMDYSKVNYSLTRAIYYASEVDGKDGKKYGNKYLFGAMFGKPIVNATAAFTIGSLPIVLIDDVDRKKGSKKTAQVEYADGQVNKWLQDNRANIFRLVRNCFRDGDYYVEVKDDLSLDLIPPDMVEIVDDPVNGEVLGYDITNMVNSRNDKGVDVKIKYVTEYRKTSPYKKAYKLDEKGNKEYLPDYEVNDETLKEKFGREVKEYPLPIIAFQNEREGRQRYGNSDYQSCYYAMMRYTDVLDNAIENNIYNSNAMPVVTGIKNFDRFIEVNGEIDDETGEREVKWDAKKLMLLGEGQDAKTVEGSKNAAEVQIILNLLFWLICQSSETPEFVMGTAVQSSKASVSEQMPVMLQKASRKRGEISDPLMQLVKLFMYKKSILDPKMPTKDVSLDLKWLPIIERDLSVNREIVETLSNQGCITDKTKLQMLKVNDYVVDVDQEIEDANKEAEDKQKKMDLYNRDNETEEEIEDDDKRGAKERKKITKEMSETVQEQWVTLKDGRHILLGGGGDGGGGSSGGKGGKSKGGGGGSAVKDGEEIISDYMSDKDIAKVDDKLLENIDGDDYGRDAILGRIYEKQGFNAKPTLLSKEDFDKEIGRGKHIEVFRGVTEKAHADDFKTGDTHYPGKGIYGNGTYTSDQIDTANKYANALNANGAVMRIGLRKDAKIIDYNELRDEMMANQVGLLNYNPITVARKQGEKNGWSDKKITEEFTRLSLEKHELEKKANKIFADDGRYAALRGYDAIQATFQRGESYYIILNRGKLIVEK